MTVRELIEELSRLDPELAVRIICGEPDVYEADLEFVNVNSRRVLLT